MCTSKRDDSKLETTFKQSRFKHLGELHKEWTEAVAFQFKFKLVLFIVWRRAEVGFVSYCIVSLVSVERLLGHLL